MDRENLLKIYEDLKDKDDQESDKEFIVDERKMLDIVTRINRCVKIMKERSSVLVLKSRQRLEKDVSVSDFGRPGSHPRNNDSIELHGLQGIPLQRLRLPKPAVQVVGEPTRRETCKSDREYAYM